MRHDAAVVDLDVRRVEDFRRELHRFARLDAIGSGRHVDLAGDAVDEPANEPPPEHRMRRIGDRHLGVHAPDPRVLHRHGERLAAAVALKREHDVILPRLVRAGEQNRGAGFDFADQVHRGQIRHLGPLAGRRLVGGADLRDGRERAGARRPHGQLREVLRVRGAHRRREAPRRPACRPSRLRQTIAGRRASAARRRACSRSRPACAAAPARTMRPRRCRE